MANINPGDIVRYLNAVGGGRVVRIDGPTAYVEEEGFETPVLLRECVVVARAGDQPTTTHFRPVGPAPKAAKADAVQPEAPKAEPAKAPLPEPEPEVEEVEGNDRLNAVLAFEPRNIKALSQTTYDAYFVNDSNYYLQVTVAWAEAGSAQWTLLRSTVVEPNMQVLLAELPREAVGKLEKVTVQWLAWKQGRTYEMKSPGWVERRLDTVKFFKLHCFKPTVYFDTPVIEIPLVKDDAVLSTPRETQGEEEAVRRLADTLGRSETRPVRKDPRRQQQRRRDIPRTPQKPENITVRKGDILEVDLHSYELFDSTRGLSNADILNRQIDEFEAVMQDNLSRHGQKIVFIHGKGEGVLRQALMKELTHRYKDRVDVQDASFREYGFGATQVTIR